MYLSNMGTQNFYLSLGTVVLLDTNSIHINSIFLIMFLNDQIRKIKNLRKDNKDYDEKMQ